MVTRRQVGFGVVGVLGLGVAFRLGTQVEDQGGQDGGDGGFQESNDDPIESFDRTWQLTEDQYRGNPFEVDQSATVQYEATVRTGPEIDFFILDEREYRHYQNGENFVYLSELSEPATVFASVSGELGEGEYAFVADNTEAGDAQPPTDFQDNIARIEVQFEVIP